MERRMPVSLAPTRLEKTVNIDQRLSIVSGQRLAFGWANPCGCQRLRQRLTNWLASSHYPPPRSDCKAFVHFLSIIRNCLCLRRLFDWSMGGGGGGGRNWCCKSNLWVDWRWLRWNSGCVPAADGRQVSAGPSWFIGAGGWAEPRCDLPKVNKSQSQPGY